VSTSPGRLDRSRRLALGALLANALLFSTLPGCAASGGAPPPAGYAEAPSPGSAESKTEHEPAAPEGKPAPSAPADGLAFTLPSGSGPQVSRADLTRSGPAVIFFYRGSWCPSCRQQLRQINSVQAALSQRGVGLAAISADEPEEAKRTAARLGLRFPVLSDEDLTVSRAYKAASADDEFAQPALVVLRKNGTVHWKQIGELSVDESFAKLVVERAAEAGANER
jgi:peroxiredoxin